MDELREINCHLCFSEVSNAADRARQPAGRWKGMAEGAMNRSQGARWVRTKKKDKQGSPSRRLEWEGRGGEGAKEEESRL